MAKPSLILIMAILAIRTAKKEISQEMQCQDISEKRKLRFRQPLIQSGWFLAIMIAVLLPLMYIIDANQSIWYATHGFISTITSFGGGEAYISVADGIFVAEEFIQAQIFYSQVLPIANGLPGPILVKVLSGVGYIWGVEVAGQVGGWTGALMGMTIGVGATCIFFVFIFAVYKCFASLEIFNILKQRILPVICGLLISTSLSMLGQRMAITASFNMNSIISLTIFGGIVALCWFLNKKIRIPDVFNIILSGLISLLLISLF
jgi:chromate transporter